MRGKQTGRHSSTFPPPPTLKCRAVDQQAVGWGIKCVPTECQTLSLCNLRSHKKMIFTSKANIIVNWHLLALWIPEIRAGKCHSHSPNQREGGEIVEKLASTPNPPKCSSYPIVCFPNSESQLVNPNHEKANGKQSPEYYCLV